jgi:hypothetical protein
MTEFADVVVDALFEGAEIRLPARPPGVPEAGRDAPCSPQRRCATAAARPLLSGHGERIGAIWA